MKIVQINAVYEYSSTGRTTKEMHEYFLNHEIDSYVFCMNVNNPQKHIYKIGCNLDYCVHSFFSHLLGHQGAYSYLSTKKLIRQINNIKPEVVHLRVLHSNFINLSMLLSYLSDNNIGVVLTFHDLWYITGHCCYFVDSKCDHWKNQCGNCPDLKNWNTSWFFDRTKRNLLEKKEGFAKLRKLALVGVSDWVKSFFDDSILKEAAIKTRIYNWIDTDLFKPIQNNLILRNLNINTNFIVLCVAQNWTSTKGIKDVLSIAALRPDYQFILVGSITGDFVFTSNVYCYGTVSDVNILVQLYSASDVFFNPSTRETFGKVTLEAMSCGTPVVGYNSTATPELIPEGCGFVVPVGDISSALNSIDKINDKGKVAFADNCRKWATSEFSKDKLIKDYISLYSTVSKI